jgi:dihydrofolate reductase
VSKYRIETGDQRRNYQVKEPRWRVGGNIIVYGGSLVDSYLIKENLLEEYYLFINPVAIGNEKTIFKDLKDIHKLSIIESITFDSKTVLL